MKFIGFNFKKHKTMKIKTIVKSFFVLVAILIVAYAGTKIYNDVHTETLVNCKVINLSQQNLVNGNGTLKTDVRYLIATDKGTFICENSWANWKFNNSDIYLNLRQDSTYNLKVCGIGKTFFYGL